METEKKLIILVDDNLANLQSLKNALSEKYHVATAPSAEKLFALLENNKPVLILLDIDMPDVNGYQTIKVLKFRPDTKDIPVIFLTGKTTQDEELEGLSLGAIDYLIKPIQSRLLLKRVDMNLFLEEQKQKLIKIGELVKDSEDAICKQIKSLLE